MRILLLDLDAVRPDHLGCYGYMRSTSPNIDRIAAEGVTYHNLYSSDAPCLPARAAWATGRFGFHTGIVGHGGTAADMRIVGPGRRFRDRCSRENLPAFLRKCGLKTASVTPFADRHGAWWFHAGFSEVHNTGKAGLESAEDITPTALRWIEQNALRENWFLHVNYWDAHTPYRAPAEFGNPFAAAPIHEWLTEEILEAHRDKIGPHGPREINMYDNATHPKYPRHPGELKNMDDVHAMMDGYDCGISYMDSHIGQLFAALEKAGVMKDLAVIITSDHGENMGELGIYGDHPTADSITCRIPMIIRWPGKSKAGHEDEGLHYGLDLLPTLAELMGKPPLPGWDGRSFLPTLDGRDCAREQLILTQGAHVCQRGVRFGPWMYIRTYHDGYHLFPDEMLFNLDEDPYEQNDLAEHKRDICNEASSHLQHWHDEMMQTMPPGYQADPLWTVLEEGGPEHARGALPEYCKRLQATGRSWAVEELWKRHPHEFSK